VPAIRPILGLAILPRKLIGEVGFPLSLRASRTILPLPRCLRAGLRSEKFVLAQAFLPAVFTCNPFSNFLFTPIIVLSSRNLTNLPGVHLRSPFRRVTLQRSPPSYQGDALLNLAHCSPSLLRSGLDMNRPIFLARPSPRPFVVAMPFLPRRRFCFSERDCSTVFDRPLHFPKPRLRRGSSCAGSDSNKMLPLKTSNGLLYFTSLFFFVASIPAECVPSGPFPRIFSSFYLYVPFPGQTYDFNVGVFE